MSIIKLIHGSCADQNVDAIVNAANRNLLAGSGICGAIFSKAGYEELTKACNEIETPLKDGEVAITPAFNITNARKIIHAVGPNFVINPDAFDKLFLAYYNSMKLLKDSFLHTIAFPLISSGIFGGILENPVKESTKQCIEAYFKFNQEFEDCNIEVLLCAYTESEYYDALAVFKEYKLDNLVIERCRKLNVLTEEDKAIWQEGKKENDVITLGYPKYNENVNEWIDKMYKYNLMDRDYQENYNLIKEKDIEILSIDEILTMFTFYIRGERFSEGLIDSGIKDGKLVKLSKRLKELLLTIE